MVSEGICNKIWPFSYCLISRHLVGLLWHQGTSLYTYYLKNHWNIFCGTCVLAFHFSVVLWWIPLTRKYLLAAAFYCSNPSPLPVWFKLILLDILNSIKFNSFYDLYICFLRHINYPVCNLTYSTLEFGSPKFYQVEFMFWSLPLLPAAYLLYCSQLSISTELVSLLIEFW